MDDHVVTLTGANACSPSCACPRDDRHQARHHHALGGALGGRLPRRARRQPSTVTAQNELI